MPEHWPFAALKAGTGGRAREFEHATARRRRQVRPPTLESMILNLGQVWGKGQFPLPPFARVYGGKGVGNCPTCPTCPTEPVRLPRRAELPACARA